MSYRDQIVEVLKTIDDPELFIDIWTLGLIYNIEVEEGLVKITMTFTSPACPAGPYLVEQIKSKVQSIEGINDTEVHVVFSPPWQPSEDLKAMMGIY